MKHGLEVDGRFAICDGGVQPLRAIAAHGTLARRQLRSGGPTVTLGAISDEPNPYSAPGSRRLDQVRELQSARRSAFALILTRIDSAFAGRAYAAYGGIYIATSLAWLWVVERQVPARADVLGAALAIVGALVIIGLAGVGAATNG